MRKKRPESFALGAIHALVAISLMWGDPALASHRPCVESSGAGNDFSISAGPATTDATGIGGRMEIRTVHLEAYGGLKVESLYLILDRGFFLEFGWSQDRGGTQSGPRNIFHARSYNGSYHGQDIEEGDQLLGNQYLAMFHSPSEGSRFRFSRNGTLYPSNVRRSPPFKVTAPVAISETSNECDDGSAQFWTLDYRSKNDSDVWFDWSGTHIHCDRFTHFGYSATGSDSFASEPRSDTWVSPSSCESGG